MMITRMTAAFLVLCASASFANAQGLLSPQCQGGSCSTACGPQRQSGSWNTQPGGTSSFFQGGSGGRYGNSFPSQGYPGSVGTNGWNTTQPNGLLDGFFNRMRPGSQQPGSWKFGSQNLGQLGQPNRYRPGVNDFETRNQPRFPSQTQPEPFRNVPGNPTLGNPIYTSIPSGTVPVRVLPQSSNGWTLN